MLRLTVSAGMLAALAFSTARRKRGLMARSPPPRRAATMISRMTRVQTLPRFSSWRPFLCWIFAHLLCQATGKTFFALSVDIFAPLSQLGTEQNGLAILDQSRKVVILLFKP